MNKNEVTWDSKMTDRYMMCMKDDDDKDEHGFMLLIFDDFYSLLTLNRGSNNNQRTTILLKRNVPFCITRVYVWGSLFPEKFGVVVFLCDDDMSHMHFIPHTTRVKRENWRRKKRWREETTTVRTDR